MPIAARYDDPAARIGVVNDVLSLQLARRSVRKFGTREITDDELAALIAAAGAPWPAVMVTAAPATPRLWATSSRS